MSLTRPRCPKAEHANINSLNKRSDVGREGSVKDLGHSMVRRVDLLTVKFLLDSIIDVQNAYAVAIDADVLSLVA